MGCRLVVVGEAFHGFRETARVKGHLFQGNRGGKCNF